MFFSTTFDSHHRAVNSSAKCISKLWITRGFWYYSLCAHFVFNVRYYPCYFQWMCCGTDQLNAYKNVGLPEASDIFFHVYMLYPMFFTTSVNFCGCLVEQLNQMLLKTLDYLRLLIYSLWAHFVFNVLHYLFTFCWCVVKPISYMLIQLLHLNYYSKPSVWDTRLGTHSHHSIGLIAFRIVAGVGI
jgi:hypothetical protein